MFLGKALPVRSSAASVPRGKEAGGGGPPEVDPGGGANLASFSGGFLLGGKGGAVQTVDGGARPPDPTLAKVEEEVGFPVPQRSRSFRSGVEGGVEHERGRHDHHELCDVEILSAS